MTMLATLKRWLEPPDFAGDEEKTARARVFNTLLINLGAALLVAIFGLTPFFVVQKLGVLILLCALLASVSLGRWLLFRGRQAAAAALVVGAAWACFLALSVLASGSNNPAMFFLASVVLIAGFVLSERLVNGLALLTALIALLVAWLENQGYKLPVVFVFTPLKSWLTFGLGLAFMNSVRALFMRHLDDALAQARQQSAARQEAEASVRASEAKFKAQYKGLPIPTVTWRQVGAELILADYNDRALEFTHGRIGDLLGQAASAVYRDDPETLDELRQCAGGQLNLQRERWHRLVSTGERKRLALRYVFIAPDLVMVHAEDVTERRQAEEALRLAEADYQAIFENAPVGVFQSTPQGRFRRVNPVMARIYGYPSPEAMLAEISDISRQIYVHPADRREFQAILAEQGEVLEFIGENYRRDGSIVWTQTSARAVKDAAGEVLWYEGFITDITERKRAEEALQLSERNYRTLFETLSEGVALNQAVYDENGRMVDYRILEVNPAFYTTANYAGPVAGQLASAVYHMPPEYITAFWLKHKEQRTVQYAEMTSAVSQRIFLVATSPFMDDKFVTSFFDITERKRADAALRESEAKFRAVVENSHDGILFADAAANILYRSSSYNRINGYNDEERLGRSGFETVHPEDVPGLRLYWAELLAHPEVSHQAEYRIRHKDGHWVWIETSSQNLIANPDVRSVVVTSRDITERKQAEEAQRENEARWSSVVQTANDAIVTMGADGRIASWNAAAEAIFGYTAGEAIGRPITQITPERYRARQWQGLQRVLAGGGRLMPNRTIAAAGVTKAGREFPLEMSLAEWRTRAGSYFTAIIRDVSERQQAEEEIRRSLAEKETLLRELYHRTKNNMGVVIALLELQADFAADARLTAAFADAQNRIRVMALVHQKLYEARDLSRVDLKEYIADLAALLSDSYNIAADRVAIVCELEPASVLIDSAIPCGLILNELISNALKHAFPGGRSGEIRIGLSRTADGLIQLHVVDDGVGVPPGFDFRRAGRLGVQNAFALAENQLRGRVSVEAQAGVTWRIAFRDDQYQPRV